MSTSCNVWPTVESDEALLITNMNLTEEQDTYITKAVQKLKAIYSQFQALYNALEMQTMDTIEQEAYEIAAKTLTELYAQVVAIYQETKEQFSNQSSNDVTADFCKSDYLMIRKIDSINRIFRIMQTFTTSAAADMEMLGFQPETDHDGQQSDDANQCTVLVRDDKSKPTPGKKIKQQLGAGRPVSTE